MQLNNAGKVIVVGLGEVGQPLCDLLSESYDVVGVDVTPIDLAGPVDVMHVCYPYEMTDFMGETARYIERFKPALTIIDSTVGIGTTRAIADRTGVPVVNSPVRGKHTRMLAELRSYVKFIGAMDSSSAKQAAGHFEHAGLKTRTLSSPEATELAKLAETTYFGVLIAWAQEVERYCDQTGANYDEIASIFDEIAYLPRVKFIPGTIGRHCVMPNIEILAKSFDSEMLRAIQDSNNLKIEREHRIAAGSKAGKDAVGPVSAAPPAQGRDST